MTSLGVRFSSPPQQADVESASSSRSDKDCGHHGGFSCWDLCDFDWWCKQKWLHYFLAFIVWVFATVAVAAVVLTLWKFKVGAEVAYVYDLTNQTVDAGDPVTFSDDVTTAQILHPAGSSDIIVLEAGWYQIQFYVNPTISEALIGEELGWQFSLFIDGAPAIGAGSRYGAGSTNGLPAPVGPLSSTPEAINTVQLITFIPKNSVLQVVNDGSTTDPVILTNTAGGANTAVSAAISIIQVRGKF